jgi:hypothetical protein
MRDALGWGGRKRSAVILVTADHEDAAPSLSRSVNSPTAARSARHLRDAGHLYRTRHYGKLPATLTGTYGIVHTGTITTTSTGSAADPSPRSTWNPAHQSR